MIITTIIAQTYQTLKTHTIKDNKW